MISCIALVSSKGYRPSLGCCWQADTGLLPNLPHSLLYLCHIPVVDLLQYTYSVSHPSMRENGITDRPTIYYLQQKMHKIF